MVKNQTRLNWDGTMDIMLTQGQWATIDCKDYTKINDYRWCAQKNKYGYYAVSGGSADRILMHRVILNAPLDADVDHRNNNGLDNTRDNIRICTTSQNLQNKTKRAGSQYKGVSLHKPSGKYLCHIANKHIGIFEDAYTASLWYDVAAEILFGEFARLNHKRRSLD